MDLTTILEIAAIIVGAYLFLKLLLHAGLGFLLLLVEELIGGFFDFSLGISFINCLVAGILGIPGVIILVLIKIFM